MIIRFEFHGGHKDGQVITGSPGSRYAFLTEEGRVGTRFREMPEERQEEIRRLLMPEETRRKLEAFMREMAQAMLETVGLPAEVYRQRIEELRREFLSQDQGFGKRKSDEEILELSRQLARIKPEVYEVKKRDEMADEILVRVEFVGDDDTDQLYES